MPTTLPCVQFHRRLLFPREETNNMIIRQHLYRKLYQWLRSSRWITTLRQLNETAIKITKEMILVGSKMDMCPWTMWDASWILGNSIRHWKKLSAEYIIYLDWSRNIYPWYRNFTGGDWWVRRCHIDGIFCFSSIWYVLLRLCYLSALRTNQKGERYARVVPKQFGPLPKYILPDTICIQGLSWVQAQGICMCTTYASSWATLVLLKSEKLVTNSWFRKSS